MSYLIDKLTSVTVDVFGQMLTPSHEMVLAPLLALAVEKSAGRIRDEYIVWLLGPEWTGIVTSPVEFLSNRAWGAICALASGVSDIFDVRDSNAAGNSQAWIRRSPLMDVPRMLKGGQLNSWAAWQRLSAPESAFHVLRCEHSEDGGAGLELNLSRVECLLLLKTMRPDRLGTALDQFAQDILRLNVKHTSLTSHARDRGGSASPSRMTRTLVPPNTSHGRFELFLQLQCFEPCVPVFILEDKRRSPSFSSTERLGVACPSAFGSGRVLKSLSEATFTGASTTTQSPFVARVLPLASASNLIDGAARRRRRQLHTIALMGPAGGHCRERGWLNTSSGNEQAPASSNRPPFAGGNRGVSSGTVSARSTGNASSAAAATSSSGSLKIALSDAPVQWQKPCMVGWWNSYRSQLNAIGKVLTNAMTVGSWVVLQNVHLNPDLIVLICAMLQIMLELAHSQGRRETTGTTQSGVRQDTAASSGAGILEGVEERASSSTFANSICYIGGWGVLEPRVSDGQKRVLLGGSAALAHSLHEAASSGSKGASMRRHESANENTSHDEPGGDSRRRTLEVPGMRGHATTPTSSSAPARSGAAVGASVEVKSGSESFLRVRSSGVLQSLGAALLPALAAMCRSPYAPGGPGGHGGRKVGVLLEDGRPVTADELGFAVASWLISMVQVSSEVDPSFRVFFVTDMPLAVPVSVFRHSARTFLRGHTGLQEALIDCMYSVVSQDTLDALNDPEWTRVTFAVMFLFCQIVCRGMYGMIGWTGRNDLKLTDLAAALRYFEDVWLYRGSRPGWTYIRGMVGDIMFGGTVEEKFDRRILNVYTSDIIGSQLQSAGHKLPGGFFVPQTSDFSAIVQTIRTMFPTIESGASYGIMPLADIGRDLGRSTVVRELTASVIAGSMNIIKDVTGVLRTVQSDLSAEDASLGLDVGVETREGRALAMSLGDTELGLDQSSIFSSQSGSDVVWADDIVEKDVAATAMQQSAADFTAVAQVGGEQGQGTLPVLSLARHKREIKSLTPCSHPLNLSCSVRCESFWMLYQL